MARAVRVAVVGGGVSGLVAAYRLRSELGPDAQIDLLEAGETLGGLLKTVDVGGISVDVGAEAFIVRRPEAMALVTELGLTDRLVSPTPRRPAVYSGGRLHPLPRPALMGIPAGPGAVAGLVDDADCKRIAAEPDRGLAWVPGTDVSVGELVADRFGESVVSRSVDPMLGGVYSCLSADIGVREALPALAAKLDAGSPSLSAAVAELTGRPGGSGPADTSPVFGTLIGGYRVLVDALLDAASPNVHVCSAVTDFAGNAAEGWVPLCGRSPAGSETPYDAVVLAVPAWLAGHALRSAAPEAAATLRSVERAGSAVVSLTLAPDTPLPEHSGVLVASGEDLRAKAFTFSSHKWAHLGEQGAPRSVRASFGRYGQPVPDECTQPGIDADLLTWALADLDHVCATAGAPTLSGQVIGSFIQRWELPRYAPGHLAVMSTLADRMPPGIVLAGNAYAGVGVPACIGVADAAVRRLAPQLR